MAKINDLPGGVSRAGLDFEFNVWTANSRVTLCNVPWNSDYRDIVQFSSRAALDDYLMSTPTSVIDLNRTSYLKPNEPITLDVPFSAAYKFNYIRATNSGVPNDASRSYYYFVTNVEFVSPNTTRFYVQLDVWQTFGREVEFGQCYIERGHIGIANTKQMDNNGRDFLTTPEGLDMGGEYGIADLYRTAVGGTINGSDSFSTPGVDIIVTSTVSWEKSGGTVDKPILASAMGSNFAGLPNAAEMYWFESVTDLGVILRDLSEYPWISSGIVSIMAVPDLGTPETQEFTPGFKTLTGRKCHRLKGNVAAKKIEMGANFRAVAEQYYIPQRYRNLKKFFTFPYSLVELTTHTGTPIILKPESMYGNNISVTQLLHVALPNPRALYYPTRYNQMRYAGGDWPPEFDAGTDGGEFLDMATSINNFPTFSVLNNSYMNFLANNSNSLAFQHSSADWSQQKALMGNTLGANQATAGLATGQANAQVGMSAQQQANDISTRAAALQTAVGVGGNLVGGAGGGAAGIGAAAMGGVGAVAGRAISTDAQNAQTAVSLSAQRRTLANNQGLGTYMRDSNKAFADMAANGDYENTIAGINAKVQDARMIQPTTSGQVGGDAFLLATYRWEVMAKVKMLMPNAMAVIGEYWLRYGYAINRFVKPPKDLMVMNKFTYWKMKETYITSSQCPETFRQSIRGIFEKGVTVWANPKDMGQIDMATNTPKAGISL